MKAILLMRRALPAWLMLVATVACNVACNKEKAAPVALPASERVAPSPVGTNQTILQKTFAVKGTETFPFQIPAHAVRPHLHGIFESFAGEVHGASDDSANVDFLILNEDQYADFAGGRAGEALFSVEGSHNQAVNFDLPASLDQPVKYYIVFRKASGASGKRVVEANFRVDF